jgi:hypothetical protein
MCAKFTKSFRKIALHSERGAYITVFESFAGRSHWFGGPRLALHLHRPGGKDKTTTQEGDASSHVRCIAGCFPEFQKTEA